MVEINKGIFSFKALKLKRGKINYCAPLKYGKLPYELNYLLCQYISIKTLVYQHNLVYLKRICFDDTIRLDYFIRSWNGYEKTKVLSHHQLRCNVSICESIMKLILRFKLQECLSAWKLKFINFLWRIQQQPAGSFSDYFLYVRGVTAPNLVQDLIKVVMIKSLDLSH